MSDPVLDVRNLHVEFKSEEKPTVAVDGINFTLQRGQILGIVGESGSGKSVTSLAIMDLIPHPGKITQGEIWFRQSENHEPINLRQVSEEKRREYRGGKISMIFQEPMSSLNPVYNIGFQITEAIQLHENISLENARRKAIALLQKVKLLPSDQKLKEEYLEREKKSISQISQRQIDQQINQQKQAILKRYPHELSGGQLQRVMIAMAISCNPTILIADEPTTALDVTVQATILDLLGELCRQENMSMIFITHDLGVIANIADAVAVMYQGKIVEFANKENIIQDPQHPYTKGLLACRPRLDRQVEYLPTVSDFMDVENDATGKILSIQEKEAPQLQFINTQQETQRLSELRKYGPLLSVKDLYVGFPKRGIFGQPKSNFMAVKGVEFDIYPGETLGLVGESGCGKSTLARTVLRLIPALQGKILFKKNNQDNNFNSITHLDGESLRQLRRSMQIVFQNPYNSLNPRLTIGKAIREPMIIHNLSQQQKRVKYLLECVGLDPSWINRYPHELSGGQRQRVCIARALAAGFDDSIKDNPFALNPQFIICDESVSALDVSVQAQVLNLLKELQKKFGLTYLFISHDFSVVRFMSDRIMVMNQGKIEDIDAAEEIIKHPKSDYTRRLIASIPQFPTASSSL